MTAFRKKNIVLILGIAVILTCLCGCGKDPVFVNADTLQTVTKETKTDQFIEAEREKESQEEAVEAKMQEAEPDEEAVECIMVHVCGAVKKSGVYELREGSRVIDAVNIAGGLLEQAASDYVNLAAFVSDGDKVWIPTVEEVEKILAERKEVSYITTFDQNGVIRGDSNPKGTDKININTADKELLCSLPGIGSTRAESIITYREQNGGFHSIEDIMNVSGIKESSFQKIKEYISIN